MAGTTGLEPAASAVTGQRSNQLNYVPTRQINKLRNNQCLCGIAPLHKLHPIVQNDPNCSYSGSEPPIKLGHFPAPLNEQTPCKGCSWRSRLSPPWAEPPAKLSQITVTEIS